MADKIIIREERHRDHALNRIQALKIDPAAPMEVTIKPYKRNRSLEQNNLMWDWFDDIAKSTGHTPEGVHQGFMREHLRPVLHETPFGISEQYSTSKLKVKEMSEFMEKIEFTAGEMGIALRMPHRSVNGIRSESEK